MILRLVPVVFALAVMASSARSDDVILAWKLAAGPWSGGAYITAGGDFTHCAVSRSYQNQPVLAFGITGDYMMSLVLLSEDWALPVGDAYSVALAVDGVALGNFPGTVTSQESVLIELGNNAGLFGRLRGGRRLSVVAARETFRFDLTGTDEAFGKVLDCVDLSTAVAGGGTNPFAGAPAAGRGSSASGEGSLRGDEVNDQTAATLLSILAAAGMSDVQLLDPVSYGFEDVDYAWTDYIMVGMLRSYDRAEATADRVAKNFLSGLASDCDGRFGSQFEPEENIGAARFLQFSLACQRTDGTQDFWAATVVGYRDEVLLFANMTLDAPQRAQEVNTALGAVLIKLATGR